MFIAAVSASQADEVSAEVAQKKDAEARAAASRKEANSLQVPDKVLQKLDYRDWACREENVAEGPKAKTIRTVRDTTITGRVTKIYFKPAFTTSKKQPQNKVDLRSFVVESKSGQTTEIYHAIPGTAEKAGSHYYVMKSSGSGAADRKYLDLLLKKIRP